VQRSETRYRVLGVVRDSAFRLTYPDEAKFQFFLPYYIINKEKKGLKFGSEENFTHYFYPSVALAKGEYY